MFGTAAGTHGLYRETILRGRPTPPINRYSSPSNVSEYCRYWVHSAALWDRQVALLPPMCRGGSWKDHWRCVKHRSISFCYDSSCAKLARKFINFERGDDIFPTSQYPSILEETMCIYYWKVKRTNSICTIIQYREFKYLIYSIFKIRRNAFIARKMKPISHI